MSIYAALSLACLLIVGLLAGCEAAPPPGTPQVDASATPARELAESVGSDEQLSLDDRLTCQEAELFEQPPWVQVAWLAHGNALSCEVDPGSAPEPPATQVYTGTDDGGPPRPAATCAGNGSLRLFGLPVIAVRVAASGEPAQGLQIDLQVGVAELAAAASDALEVPLLARQTDPRFGRRESYQAVGDDGGVYYVSVWRAGARPDEPDPAGQAQTGKPPTDPFPVELATFGCLVPRPVNGVDGSTTDPDMDRAADIRQFVQTSPSLSQPSPLPRL